MKDGSIVKEWWKELIEEIKENWFKDLT
jgi:hypothetical protein